MANKIPLKARYTGTDVTALGEFESSDIISSSYLDLSSVVNITATNGSAQLPSGTTAQRGTGAAGYIRYNTTTGQFEGYGSTWGSLGGGATGGGSDAVFVENDQTVTTNYTLGTNKNASSVGPVTINTGKTVTVPTGARWVIL